MDMGAKVEVGMGRRGWQSSIVSCRVWDNQCHFQATASAGSDDAALNAMRSALPCPPCLPASGSSQWGSCTEAH